MTETGPSLADERPVRVFTRLTGWKAIASYVGRGVRTAQRWERECGLPVRRMGGTSEAGGRAESVFAYAAEVDVWLASPDAAKARGDGARPGRPRTNRRRSAPQAAPVRPLPAPRVETSSGRRTSTHPLLWVLIAVAVLLILS